MSAPRAAAPALAAIGPDRRRQAVPFLLAGYALGIPGTLMAPSTMRERRVGRFAALLTGSGLITTGWALYGRRQGVVINAAGAGGFVLWWVLTARGS